MISDPLIRAYIAEINKVLKEETEAFVSAPFDSMYVVGRSQGKVDGLRAALEIFYKISEELDM